MGAPVPLRAPAETPGAGRGHAVINALIEELPNVGTPWPLEQRRAWLDLMETAFTLAYGGAAGGSMKTAMAARSAPKGRPAKAAKPKPPKKPKGIVKPDAGFHIDGQGFARDHKGNAVLPEDVAGPLVDLRGEHGDLGAITWADGSKGVKGLQLDITTAPV